MLLLLPLQLLARAQAREGGLQQGFLSLQLAQARERLLQWSLPLQLQLQAQAREGELQQGFLSLQLAQAREEKPQQGVPLPLHLQLQQGLLLLQLAQEEKLQQRLLLLQPLLGMALAKEEQLLQRQLAFFSFFCFVCFPETVLEDNPDLGEDSQLPPRTPEEAGGKGSGSAGGKGKGPPSDSSKATDVPGFLFVLVCFETALNLRFLSPSLLLLLLVLEEKERASF